MYLDYRGRIYNRDPYFSYQSNDLARGHFLFAEEKEVDQDPIWKDLTKVEVDIGIDVLSKYVSENRLKKFQEVLKSRSKLAPQPTKPPSLIYALIKGGNCLKAIILLTSDIGRMFISILFLPNALT